MEIAVVLCSMLVVALPVIAADQTTQKAITTASEDDFTLGIYGNANMDDTIDMRDTTYTKLVIFGKKPKTDFADANYDGKVSMLDVGQTKLIILGKEKKLTLIDLADRTVTINKPVERVVLGYGRDIHNFAAVEGEDFAKKIVGWGPDLKRSDRDTYNKYKEKFPEIEDIPEVGYHYYGTFSVEKVITLKPNIVILQSGIRESAEDDVKKLEKAGIPLIFIAFRGEPNDDDPPIKSTLLLGYVLDKEERAHDIVDFCEEQVNKVYSRLEEIDKPEPTVYIEGGWKGPSDYSNTYSSKSAFWGVQVKKAGAINIADGVIERMAPLNLEYVLDANPEIIIITGSYWPDTPDSMRLGYYADPEESRELLKGFTNRPGWDTLNAVKNHRVHSVFHMTPSHLYNFLAIQALAKCFYPDEFKDLDPEESFKEYHERFLPVDYSGVWMLSLEE